MAVKLRLARFGAKKSPFYRIVAAESRARRDGRFLEQVGTYDPRQDPAKVALVADRVRHWLQVGAKPTPTVQNIIDQHLSDA